MQDNLSRNWKIIYSLIFVATLLRLYLISAMGLSEDEAYYWDWSRNLSWSYYDHPGMTAWLIALSNKIFGVSAFSTRLPTLLLNTLGWYLLARLAQKMFDSTAAVVVAVLYFLIPVYSLGGLLTVPDIPMIICWIGVMYLSWVMLVEEKLSASLTWIFIGILMGLGTLSKYPMVLCGLSLILFVSLTPKLRFHLKTPWPWLAILIWAIVSSPIVFWNMEHGGASTNFQILSRISSTDSLSVTRWFTFWGTQLGYLTPFIFGVFVWAFVYSAKHIQDSRFRFAVCFSLPTILVFSTQSLVTQFKPHWPAPGYLPLLLVSGYLWTTMEKRKNLLTGVVLAFLIPLSVVFYIGCVYPVIPKLHRVFSPHVPWNPRFDPTNDMYGQEELRKTIEALQENEVAQGKEKPFLVGHRYQISSGIAFATKQKVYSLSSGTEHYDYIQTPQELEKLKGKSAIIVGDNKYGEKAHEGDLFASCEKKESLPIYRADELSRQFDIWLCTNYSGRPY